MKISIIGAGNVGGLTALRLAAWQAGEIILIDTAKGLARAKAFDLQDSRYLTKINHSVSGTEDITAIAGSNIVIITAGLTRRPGMTREELLEKNANIVKELCLDIRQLSPEAIVIVVTNPLDLIVNLVAKITGFNYKRVLGMGLSLDASRFANLISEELNIDISLIEPCVMGSHGQDMLPLARFTKVNGVPLDELLPEDKVNQLVKRTIERGAEIISFFGSAYFAPSAAIAEIAKAIIKDEKRIIAVSTYLNGEYAIKDACLGVPCRLGKLGIEQIIELELDSVEKEKLLNSALAIKEQLKKMSGAFAAY